VDDETRTVVKIRGDDAYKATKGFICPKGVALKDLQEDKDRLTKPLIRENGRLREASWSEALERMRSLLGPIVRSSGPDAIAFDLGTPMTHNYGIWIYGWTALKLFGARQVYTTATVDHMPMMVASALMFGGKDTRSFSVPIPDVDRCHTLVLIGCNPLVSNATGITVPRGRLHAIQERGGRIVVIDPVRTETARMAQQHVALLPGTDALLFAAMLQVVFAEKLERLDAIDKHLNGIEELRQSVRRFTPEAVAERCGIGADVIRQLARDMAASPSVAFYPRTGAMIQAFGALTFWLQIAFAAVTGNLDREGGNLFPRGAAATNNTRGTPQFGPAPQFGRWKTNVEGWPEVLGELPVAALPDEILAPNTGVRALVTMAGNRARSGPDSAKYEAAAKTLEAMICIDFYVNETTRHADVILPPPPLLERDHYDIFFEQLASANHTRYTAAALPRRPGAPSEHELLLELTAVLAGLESVDRGTIDDILLSALVHEIADEAGGVAQGMDPQEMLRLLGNERGSERGLDLLLRVGPYGDLFGANPRGLSLAKLKANPNGIDLGPLKPRLPEVLRTPSGKVELAPAALVSDLDRLWSSRGDPESLVLVGRRHMRSSNSWMHNLEMLVKGKERCTLQVHPNDAAQAQLTDGGLCEISSAVGAVTAVVEITDDVREGVISLPHGWGHEGDDLRLSVAVKHPGTNANALTGPAGLDHVGGTAALNGVPVGIRRVHDVQLTV